MYSIVIADDEQLELMVLRQELEEYLGDRCAVRTANNGREAVETALLAEADLAILDIEMPGMNGLEAARIITEKIPHCKIIILTAHSDFEYAREAITVGSADYLLKPYADETLHRTLDRVLRQIDRYRAREVEKERSTQRIQTLSLQLEEQIVRTVMGGHIAPSYILTQMKNYGVNFHNGVFAILYSPKAGSDQDIVSALKGSTWPPQIHPFLYSYDGKVYIVNVSDDPETESAAVTIAQLTLLSQAANTLWGRPLFAAVGKGFSNLHNAQMSCFQAQVALGKCTHDQPVVTYREEESAAESAGFTDNPIINSVLFGDFEEIGRVASSFVNNLFAQHLEFDILISRLNLYLAKTVQSLRLQTGLSVSDIVISIPAEQAEQIDVDTLQYNVTSRLCHLADQLLAQEDDKDAGHLQKVKCEIKRYVAQHYQEDLFIPGIARAMNYSGAYFSKLFKQCFQQNFISYLTDVRIDAAKSLMEDANLTIREIGERVGYKDPNYFTKVFRKAAGVSPTEYRELKLGRNGA